MEASQVDTDKYPGINVETALERIACPLALFESILMEFHELQSGIVNEISDLLAANDLAQARVLAHTLKGSALNLSAEHLGQLSLDMEQACFQEDMESALSQLPELKLEIDKVMSGIAALSETKSD